MDDKEIKIDLKWFDDLLANVNGTQMNLFDDNNYIHNNGAGTISTAATGAVGNIYPYVISTNGTGPGLLPVTGQYTFSSPGLDPSPGLHVRGDAEFEGDVKIKGKSITDTLDKIEQRLAILHPNEKLEEKWLELKKLGDMYRELEKDILSKEKIWEILKK